MALDAQKVEVLILVAAALFERHVVVNLIAPWQPHAAAALALEPLLDSDALPSLHPLATAYAWRRACLCFECANAIRVHRLDARLERR